MSVRPPMVITEVDPNANERGTVSWIEQVTLMCEPRAQRNFLMVLKGDDLRAIEMLPGTSAADPVLQRDAMPNVLLVLNAASPKECQQPVATDSKIIGPAPTGGKPWCERWTFDACGKKAEVDITFTPSPNGGTDWAASPVKMIADLFDASECDARACPLISFAAPPSQNLAAQIDQWPHFAGRKSLL